MLKEILLRKFQKIRGVVFVPTVIDFFLVSYRFVLVFFIALPSVYKQNIFKNINSEVILRL